MTIAYPLASAHTLPRGRVALAEARPAHVSREESAHESDGLAVSLRLALDRVASPLARAAVAFVDQEAWQPFGYARLSDHARERFGRSSRWVRDLAGLGGALARLPRLEAALSGDDGGVPLGRVAAMQVEKAAGPDSLEEWIARARRCSVRELREQVRAARAGETEPLTDETDDPGDHVLVKVEAPGPVGAAFEEALELYRAVEGGEAPVASFVEALVAESSQAETLVPTGTGLESRGIVHGTPRAVVESALEKSTSSWESLRRRFKMCRPAALAIDALRRLEELSRRAGTGDPAELDAQIRGLIALEDQLELRLGEILARMADCGAWARLRFDGAVHYAEERLGLSRTGARQRLRAARALRRLPCLREAYEEGTLGLEATLQLVRILEHAAPDREAQGHWVERAREATIKRLKDEARSILRRRTAWPDPDAPRPMEDAAWRASLERRAGLARERVEAWGAMVGSRSRTDVFLRFRLSANLAGAFVAAIEARRRRIEIETESCRRLPAWMGLLEMLREFVATWDASPRRRGEEIYERDGYRCAAPGCTSRRNLEDHHVLYRSRGGGNGRDNRICLCRFHHQRGEHGGLARCRGEAPLGITWRLGVFGDRYRNEMRLA